MLDFSVLSAINALEHVINKAKGAFIMGEFWITIVGYLGTKSCKV